MKYIDIKYLSINNNNNNINYKQPAYCLLIKFIFNMSQLIQGLVCEFVFNSFIMYPDHIRICMWRGFHCIRDLV